MEIVKLALEDWQSYRNLRLRALKEDAQAFGASYQKNFDYPEEEWKRRLQNALDGNDRWLLFAKENNKLVGMIGAFLEEDNPNVAHLTGVFVPKEERGRGISNLLLIEILKGISKNPQVTAVRSSISLTQKVSVMVHKKFGFKEIEREKHPMGNGQSATLLVMEKKI